MADNNKNFDLMYTVLGVSSREALTRAIAALDGQLVVEPDNTQARLARATALLFRGHASEALPEIDACLEKAPDSFWAHYLRGLAAWSLEQHSRTQESFERALDIDPDHEEALARFALFMACERAPRPATQAIERALNGAPKHVLSWKAQALLHYRTQNFTACSKAIDTCLELNGQQDDLKILKAEILISAGKISEARSLIAPLLGSLPWGDEASELVRKIDRGERIAEKFEKDDRFVDAVLGDAVLKNRMRERLETWRWMLIIGIAAGAVWAFVQLTI